MKTWKKIALAGAVIGGGIWAFKWLKNAIEWNFRGIRFKSGDLNGVKLGLRFMLHNTRSVPITIESFDGLISYGKSNGYKLADLDIKNPIRLEPDEREEMEMLFSVTSLKIIAEILRLVADKDYGVKKFFVRGVLKITPIGDATLTVPIRSAITLTD